MLKIYKVRDYISIDGADWREVVWSWFIPTQYKTSNEPLDSEYILCDVSFDNAREYLRNNELDGIFNVHSYWTNAPKKIAVRYDDARDLVYYKHFNTISYKREYEEWTDVSLKWIIENLSADECIQYLKERGITTCQMNF